MTLSPAGEMIVRSEDTGYNKFKHGRPIMNLLDRITQEPGKCGGRPCIRGTRMRVADIIDLLAAGASEHEILNDYPTLERDDIRAALLFAARSTDPPPLQVA